MFLRLLLPFLISSNVFSEQLFSDVNHSIDPCDDFYGHVCSGTGKRSYFDETAGKWVKDAISPFYSKEIQRFIEELEGDKESTEAGNIPENDKKSLCELAGKNNEDDCEQYFSSELPTNRIKMPGGPRKLLESILNFTAFQRFIASNGTFLQKQRILQQYFLLLKDRVSRQFKKAMWTNYYPGLWKDMDKVSLISYEASPIEYESVIANISWMYHQCKKLSPLPSREFLDLCESYALSPALSIFLQLTEEDWELFFETGLFAHQGNYYQDEKKIRLYPLFYLLDQRNFPYLLGTTLFAMSHELSHVFFNDQGAIPPQKQCFEEQMIESCEIFVKEGNCSERANRFMEDAADWVAMRTSLYFLEENLKDGELRDLKRDFFYAHAMSWCNENPNQGSQKHSPAKLRVNGLNRMFPEFQEVFQCSSESKMTKINTCPSLLEDL